jgi:hypothetical protein
MALFEKWNPAVIVRESGDPVFQSSCDGIEKLRRTGYPAFAGYDSFSSGR